MSEREEVAYFMRRLYRQCLTTTSGGNLSCRAGPEHIAITGSGTDKAEIQASGVGVMGLDGKNLTPEVRPSIESAMHLELYHRHSHVNAVVHAHPTTASLFCASDTFIDTHLTAEAYVIVGDPVVAEYALMGSERLAAVVADAVHSGVCVLMRNHGVLTVGTSLLEAFDRLEVLEVAARQTLMMGQLAGVSALRNTRLAELDAFIGRNPAS